MSSFGSGVGTEAPASGDSALREGVVRLHATEITSATDSNKSRFVTPQSEATHVPRATVTSGPREIASNGAPKQVSYDEFRESARGLLTNV